VAGISDFQSKEGHEQEGVRLMDAGVEQKLDRLLLSKFCDLLPQAGPAQTEGQCIEVGIGATARVA
jgi:hypothetical protein